MRAAYWLQLAVLVACMCLASMALALAWFLGNEVDVLLDVLALVLFAIFAVRVTRAAHADWLCYALTGQRMPPRRKG